jgi:hypothetical protein
MEGSQVASGSTSTQRPCLVFLQAPAQLHELSATQPELLRGATVVGLSSRMALGQAAEREGIPFLPYSDLLSALGFSQAAEDARELSFTWFTSLVGPSAPPDLLEAVRVQVQQALHEILLAHRVLTQALDDLRPGRVVLVPALDEALTALLEYECEMRSILLARTGLASLESARPGSQRRAWPGQNSWARQGGTFLRALGHAARNVPVLVAEQLRQRSQPLPLLLGFGAGVDSVNQQRLMSAIEEDGGVRAILLRSGDTDSSMFNRPGRGTHRPVHFVPWNGMLRAGRHVAECRTWWVAFQEAQADYQGEYAFLFANPHFSPFFGRIFLHLLPHAMATRRDLGNWLERLRPRLVLTSNEVSFPVRSLVLEARQRGIPTLGLIHSGLNNMYYRDFRSDRMAVWGQVHVRDFGRILGKLPSQLCPIGSPQYDTFAPYEAEGLASNAEWPRERIARVVVITAVAQWHMLYYNQREHLRAWHELERLPEYGVHVTIKPHPRFDDYDFYSSLPHPLEDWRDERAGISVARSAFLEEVLPSCDLVVVPNLPTTGAVEAMLFRKPVVHLLCGFEEADCCTSIAPGCLVVRDVTQVCAAILDVLHDRAKQKELIQKGQAYLDQLLGPRDRQATRRLAELVRTMVVDRPTRP